MMAKEQDAARSYGIPSSTRNRIRFAAHIVVQTGLIYNAVFIVFVVLTVVAAAFNAEQLSTLLQRTENAYQTIEQAVC
jgi:hypothetical protein